MFSDTYYTELVSLSVEYDQKSCFCGRRKNCFRRKYIQWIETAINIPSDKLD